MLGQHESDASKAALTIVNIVFLDFFLSPEFLSMKGTEQLLKIAKELCNIKSRHRDLYAKPDVSIGLIKKPHNLSFFL